VEKPAGGFSGVSHCLQQATSLYPSFWADLVVGKPLSELPPASAPESLTADNMPIKSSGL